MNGFLRLLAISFIFATAADASKAKGKYQFFYGKCKLRIHLKGIDHAAVMVDGVHIADSSTETVIPCGEREIRVEKAGYVPMRVYRTVSDSAPSDVNLELKKFVYPEDKALSGEMIARLRDGKKAYDENNKVELARAKARKKKLEEDGFRVVVAASAAKKEEASSEQSFEGMDFDDPNFWL